MPLLRLLGSRGAAPPLAAAAHTAASPAAASLLARMGKLLGGRASAAPPAAPQPPAGPADKSSSSSSRHSSSNLTQALAAKCGELQQQAGVPAGAAMSHLAVPPDYAQMRLDRLLTSRFHISASLAQKLIRTRQVTVERRGPPAA